DGQWGKAASGFQFVAGTVTHIEDMDSVIADGEYDPMLVLFVPAVQQLADFFGEFVVLRCQWATGRMAVKRADFLDQAVVPPCCDGGGSVLGFPADGGPDLPLGRGLDDDAVGHESGGRLNSRRISSNTSSAGRPRPARMSSRPW